MAFRVVGHTHRVSANAIVALLGLLCTWSCGSSPRAVSKTTSPDSLVDAVLYADGGGGATVGIFYDIRLQPRGSGPSHGLNIFDGYSLTCLGVRWEGKRALVIRYNDSMGQAALTRSNPVRLSFTGDSAGVVVRLEHSPRLGRDSSSGIGCVAADRSDTRPM
jgi:hypothetical protein